MSSQPRCLRKGGPGRLRMKEREITFSLKFHNDTTHTCEVKTLRSDALHRSDNGCPNGFNHTLLPVLRALCVECSPAGLRNVPFDGFEGAYTRLREVSAYHSRTGATSEAFTSIIAYRECRTFPSCNRSKITF